MKNPNFPVCDAPKKHCFELSGSIQKQGYKCILRMITVIFSVDVNHFDVTLEAILRENEVNSRASRGNIILQNKELAKSLARRLIYSISRWLLATAGS